MRRLVISALALTTGVVSTAAVALTDDPILTRKKLMWANGTGFYGLGQAMVKGEVPFSPVAAQSVFQTTSAVGYSFGDYFPEGSQQGDTRASPAIWEQMKKFQGYLAELREKSDAAVQAKVGTLEEFRPLMESINETCNACHEDFRLARN